MKNNNILQINKNLETKIYPDILSYAKLDEKITKMIDEANLTRKKNGFFNSAQSIKLTNLKPAIEIAYNWREFTKHFVFTALAGIGTLAEKTGQYISPPDNLLQVLQTAFTIISDDLMNANPVLGNVAPKGPAGIHYRWWQDTILFPLVKLSEHLGNACNPTATQETKKLLESMSRLSKNPFGSAVQLRIVEAIARDISIAFRAIYANLTINGNHVFPDHDDLAWMNAHVKAEAIHHRQATDEDGSLVRVANTPNEQSELVELAQEHINCWANYLQSFEIFLNS